LPQFAIEDDVTNDTHHAVGDAKETRWKRRKEEGVLCVCVYVNGKAFFLNAGV
jgi:hypothetical protein